MAEKELNERDLTSIAQSPARLDPSAVQNLVDHLKLTKDTAAKIREIGETPGPNILTDLPVAQDAFGFAALSRTISNIILSDETQTPLSICIDGEWGSGKTSLLKMIEQNVRMLDTPCLWLNAWSFETAESLIAAIASEVQQEIARAGRPRAMDRSVFRQLSKWASDALSSFGLALAKPAFGSALARLLSAATEHGEEVAAVASVVTARKSFENLVAVFLEESKFSNPRLVVFIDDLDRALPDQITTILKHLKLILEAKGCVFVLAMDSTVVAKSIESYYLTHVVAASGRSLYADAAFGARYLEKIIQIRAKTPALTREGVRVYLENLGITPVVQEIIRWAPDNQVLNPRRLKRYINWLSITTQLIDAVRLPPDIRNSTALRAMALRHDYPEIYQALASIGIVSIDLANQVAQSNFASPTPLFDYVSSLPPEEIRGFEDFRARTPLLDSSQLEIGYTKEVMQTEQSSIVDIASDFEDPHANFEVRPQPRADEAQAL